MYTASGGGSEAASKTRKSKNEKSFQIMARRDRRWYQLGEKQYDRSLSRRQTSQVKEASVWKVKSSARRHPMQAALGRNGRRNKTDRVYAETSPKTRGPSGKGKNYRVMVGKGKRGRLKS